MRTEIQFRELLLSGLREDRKPLETLFQEDVNWALIKEKSDMHAVSGIVFDAVLKLPDSLKPQKMFFLTWFGNVAQIEKSNKFLDDSLKQLKAYFDTGNISFVVLKGQPISRLYNIPEHRQCGDIDIVTKQEHFHSANELLMQYAEPTDTAYKKHTTYTKDDVVIEMHNYMSRMFYPVYSSRWKKYMRDVLEKESPKVDIDDCSVNVLPDTFNALYLFMHLFHHFIYSDGVGLRQFCDWALFLEKKADSIDYAEFREMSEALGLKRAVSIFGAIAIDYLGLDPEKFPFQIDEATRNMSKPVLTDILNGGSWGRNHYKDLDKDASFAQRIKYYNFRFGRAFRYGHICRKETYSFLVWRFFSAIFNLDTAED